MIRLAALGLAASLTWAVPASAAPAEPPPRPTLTAAAAHPLAGRIWLPATNRFIDVDQLVKRATLADFVLLGETHDNPDHHALQAWMVRRLNQAGHPPRQVAMEMFDRGQQARLDQYWRDHPGDAAGLGDAADWSKSGWPSWDWYRPIVQAAVDAGAAIVAANLPADTLRAIAKGQQPAPAGADPDALPRWQRQAMRDDIADGHCGLMSESSLPAMVRVQMARDASMAAALFPAAATPLPPGRPAVLIAGAGHVRADRAVPWHLARAQVAGRVLSIAFVEVEAGQTSPSSYGDAFGTRRLPFDAVWFTARAERADPCEGLRKRMSERQASPPAR